MNGFMKNAVILAFLAIGISTSKAQSCRWDGTAPFCDGECAAGEEEITRLSTWPGHWTGAVSSPAVNHFGSACVTGSKALCCGTGRAASRLVLAPVILSGANKCLDVHAPDQRSNGARVQVWDCNNSLQQTWKVEAGTIKSGAGKCLDVHVFDQHQNGAKVQVWDCNGSQQQRWTVVGRTIRSGAGKCLDVHAPDQYNNGAKVQVWDCNDTIQQTWTAP
ncbi:RICIN domain-containing protein [Lysobacter antibioticus]|uniref:RICIN domain-containing protein n=1 Tax=Lysobacter antibioticus TaxID=84531 RepID=UPI00165164B0|nr:RICIN domain-containing protein [Lysobacter antibioticus]